MKNNLLFRTINFLYNDSRKYNLKQFSKGIKTYFYFKLIKSNPLIILLDFIRVQIG